MPLAKGTAGTEFQQARAGTSQPDTLPLPTQQGAVPRARLSHSTVSGGKAGSPVKRPGKAPCRHGGV